MASNYLANALISIAGAIMGRGNFARVRGVLLNQSTKFAVLFGAVSIVGSGGELASAADNSSPSAPTAQADAVNQALMKKLETLEQRIKSLEAQGKQQNAPSASNVNGASKQPDNSKDIKSQPDKTKAGGINPPSPATRHPINREPISSTRQPISIRASATPPTSRYWALWNRL